MSNINPNPFTTRPEIDGTFGVFTSTHWIATAVGMRMLERGGNAFDAAVATAFTLQVCEPHLNGPGGDVPVIVHDMRKGSDKIEVICGQGPAPIGATIAHYKSLGLDLVPGTGLLACCVPGTFETWMLMLRDYGTMPLAEVLKPGHLLRRRRPSRWWSARAPPFRHRRATVPRSLADLGGGWLPGGKVPAAGALFANPKLGETYARILREAKSAGGNREAQIEHARRMWSKGFVAEAIDKFCRTQEVMDSSGERHRGVLTADDMARWTPRVEAPVTYQYGRYTVCKAGYWSQGPAMLQQLALLKGLIYGLDPTSVDFIHAEIVLRSSPTRTARRSMAIPILWTCQPRCCSRRNTTPSAASSLARKLPWRFGPATSRATACGSRSACRAASASRRRASASPPSESR